MYQISSRFSWQPKYSLLCVLALIFCLMTPQIGSAHPRPVSGTPLLPTPPAVVANSPAAIPTMALSLLGKTVTPLPLQEKFFVTFFSGSGIREVRADLRYPQGGSSAGPLNIYVENGATVDDWQISALAQEFEQVIYPIIHEYFGTESDIDDNGQITLLITDLESGQVSGYFDARNQYSNQVVTNSNEREMIYVNSAMLNYGLDVVFQALAHEFTHLVQWNYHWNYEPASIWFTEGMAMYGTYLVGLESSQHNRYWDFGSIHDYLRTYNSVSLVDWEQRFADYGAAYAYMVYLADHYSPGHLRRLFQDPRGDRMEAVADYLSGYGTTLEAVLADWAVANVFNLQGGSYGYRELAVGANVLDLPLLPAGMVAVPAWQPTYWRLPGRQGGASLSIRIPAQPGLAGRLVEGNVGGAWTVSNLEPVGNRLEYQRGPNEQAAVSVLVLTATEEGAAVEIEVSTPPVSSIADELEVILLPDLLLIDRYALLVRSKLGFDEVPSIEVDGLRAGMKLAVSPVGPSRSLYLSTTFVKDKLGSGPVQVVVRSYRDGQAVLLRQHLDP